MNDDLRDAEPDDTLDVTGEICPYPQLYTMEKLKKLPRGAVLKVITDHPPAGEETIPTYCNRKGYPFVIDKNGSVFQIKIRKVDA